MGGWAVAWILEKAIARSPFAVVAYIAIFRINGSDLFNRNSPKAGPCRRAVREIDSDAYPVGKSTQYRACRKIANRHHFAFDRIPYEVFILKNTYPDCITLRGSAVVIDPRSNVRPARTAGE